MPAESACVLDWTPLYRLLESLYERLKGCWEERFERCYGFWRGLVDGVVARYLDCGISTTALPASVALSARRSSCSPSPARAEVCALPAGPSGQPLSLPSCQTSCSPTSATRSASGVFTVPKLLRPYFMHHREASLEFAEVLATSDLPSDVANLISG